jgi:hypothetical protein
MGKREGDSVVRYRKISVQIWSDKKFRQLTAEAQLLFLFLLTHPHLTSLGCMRGTQAGLRSESKLTPRAFDYAWNDLQGAELVQCDGDNHLIAIPNFIRHNPPANPNAITRYANEYQQLPECDMLVAQIDHAATVVADLDKPFRVRFHKLFVKRFPEICANKELEKELEKEKELVPSAFGFDEFWEAYPNKVAKPVAQKAWDSLRPSSDLQAEMHKALSVQRQWRKWQDKDFIPHPSTYLNQRRWVTVSGDTTAGKPASVSDAVRAKLEAIAAQEAQNAN